MKLRHCRAMTRPAAAPAASYVDRVNSALAAEGLSSRVAAALLEFEGEHFQYVRWVRSGEVPQLLINELDAGVEATQFNALASIIRVASGHCRPAPQEVTVGLLAEELVVDSSRASRIAADLVERGLIARAVSQEDGRRSVLVPTEAGMALLNAFLEAKWRRTIALFRDWSEEDILAFARLFRRYTEGMRAQYPLPR
jgi:DNA-binding MarR family transcriptional regulator